MISRTSLRRQNSSPRLAIQRRTQAASLWNWNGPGLMSGRAVQDTGVSTATMSSRLIRHGVPSINSRQPSHQRASLSLMIVRIVTPMISIADDGSRALGAAAGLEGGTPKGPWGPARCLLTTAWPGTWQATFASPESVLNEIRHQLVRNGCCRKLLVVGVLVADCAVQAADEELGVGINERTGGRSCQLPPQLEDGFGQRFP